jgi:homoprotocatechuate degradation regulator HpaR
MPRARSPKPAAPSDARPAVRRAVARTSAAPDSPAAEAPHDAGGPAPVVAPSTFRHRNLPLLLLQAREGVMARFRPILNAHDITEQQWRIVRALLEHGPMEPRQIGAICRISSPSLAGVLARMDDLDLVQRERLPQDQRRVMVTLTERSHLLARRMAPEIEAAYAAIEAHIGAEFIDRFYGALDELNQLLGSIPSEGVDDEG